MHKFSSFQFQFSNFPIFHIFYFFYVQFLFSKTFLISDFKLTRENNDPRKILYEVPHPVQEYTKMQIPDKSYKTNTVRAF